jgi:phospholipase C
VSEREVERDAGRDEAEGLSRRELLAAGLGLSGALLVPKALGGALPGARLVRQAASVAPRGQDLGAIEHVVIVIQENRSFDHYFGSYRGVRGFDDRRTGSQAFTQKMPDSGKSVVPFRLDAATAKAQCAGGADIPIHDWLPQHESWNHGRMDGFVSTHARFDSVEQAPFVMSYFTRDDLAFYYALADAFTICDAYHCSVIGPTMPNRLYSLSATIDPAGTHGGPVLFTPDFTGPTPREAVASVSWPTMPEALLDHNVSWKVYQVPGTSVGPGINQNLGLGFNALLYFKQYLANPNSALYQQAFLPAWPDGFVADVQNSTLPQVSWILPSLVDSEHPSSSPDNGEGHVRQVLEPLMANPDVWAKTVVFFTYDENGGFFDHVPPPTPPAGTAGEFVTAHPLPSAASGLAGPIGLGFRVPMIVVSPFSRGGYVNSDVFDHTSLLRFLETRFGVPVPNLTKWRRRTVGDLTSTLDIGHPDRSVPALPAAMVDSPAVAAACPDNQSIAVFLNAPPALNVPTGSQLPAQEPGAARRRNAS